MFSLHFSPAASQGALPQSASALPAPPPSAPTLPHSDSSAPRLYRCPSQLLERFSNIAILDNNPRLHQAYELPVMPDLVTSIDAPALHNVEIIEPPSGTVSEESKAKYAKFGIMKIRRLKMKKHKQKKLLKKMYFVWKKDKERKEARELLAHQVNTELKRNIT